MVDVARGYAGAQQARSAGEGRLDLVEVIGSSGHGGSIGWYIACREGTNFDLNAGYVNACR